MDAKINHLTIRSEDAYTVGRFYEGFFHMRPTGTRGATEAVSIGDGRIGLNIYPRLSGHPAQLDHFGIEVDDLEAALARMGERYPAIEWLDPAASRPVGSVSAHDPDGNVFRLSQTGSTNDEDFYEADGRAQDRVIDHIALRVLHPDRVAEFYAEIFGFSPLANPPQGDNAYLSDGNITLVIIPWRISDFEGTGISARGLDHIGFRVESIAALKADLDQVSAQNNRFQPSTSVLGRGKEGAGRLTMFRTACPLGAHHLADSDGQLLDVTE